MRDTVPAKVFNYRIHPVNCTTCKYFRVHTTGASTSECLFLGRTLGVANNGDYTQLEDWAFARICDGWKKKPKTWKVYSEGTDNSPYFNDPYLSRKTLFKLWKQNQKKFGCEYSILISGKGEENE